LKTQTFNDGILDIYEVKNIAEAGKKPVKGLTKKKASALRFEERTVGMSRFWTAKQSQVQINQMLRTPRINSVSTQDVVITNGGKQYEIKQIQYIPDVEPPCMDLSLERLVAAYDIK
jgi:hypothetical protein